MTSAKLDDGSIDFWNIMARAGFNDSPINLWTFGPPELSHHGNQSYDGNRSLELTRHGGSRNRDRDEVNESAIGLSRTQTDTKKDDKDTYAHGFTLFTVVLSLVMSLFLASLDMVCGDYTMSVDDEDANIGADNPGDRHPSHHCSVSQPQRCGLVRLRLLLDRCLIAACLGQGIQIL